MELAVTKDQIAVTIEEAGRLLNFRRAAAYQKFRSGEVPGLVRIGKTNRVCVETLRRWVREQAESHAA